MQVLFVVNKPAKWPLTVPGVQVVAARQYLTDASFSSMRNARVFNLCRSYRYQTLGYYVSLLAEARGHRPQPDILTVQDMKSSAVSRILTDDLDELIESTLGHVTGERFELSIYFGKTLTKRDRSLGLALFALFPSPLLRAVFVKRDERWTWHGIRPIAGDEVPESHRPFVIEAAMEFFAGRRSASRHEASRYDLAILHDPQEPLPPSNRKAIERFIAAAERHDMAAELITRDDLGRLSEFDALFIRTTTAVDHYTFRFARRGEADGLAVIDDPLSIARCANKVFLAERLTQRRVPIPLTLLLHRDNVDEVAAQLGFPLVLKQPDSSFSMGVMKVENAADYHAQVDRLLEDSDLIIAQPFIPTEFDWRVGVLDGQPLYVCKYFMVRRHWQVVKHQGDGPVLGGRVKTLSFEEAPKRVINTAVRAARAIGDGLYGVDLKQINGKAYVVEVNDNPNVDGGYEDEVAKSSLYDKLMQSFIRRIERIRHREEQGVRR